MMMMMCVSIFNDRAQYLRRSKLACQKKATTSLSLSSKTHVRCSLLYSSYSSSSTSQIVAVSHPFRHYRAAVVVEVVAVDQRLHLDLGPFQLLLLLSRHSDGRVVSSTKAVVATLRLHLLLLISHHHHHHRHHHCYNCTMKVYDRA